MYGCAGFPAPLPSGGVEDITNLIAKTDMLWTFSQSLDDYASSCPDHYNRPQTKKPNNPNQKSVDINSETIPSDRQPRLLRPTCFSSWLFFVAGLGLARV